MAQGDESIYILYNDGKANFRIERKLRFSPLNGSAHFELFDFNKDGYLDIIYANGDNADHSVALKPNHGIHIFENDGEDNFDEIYFYPMHGAYKAVPRDFDQDGDFDIAAISFFPDLINTPEAGFIYLENNSSTNELSFQAKTFSEANTGRWIAMEVADIDNDNDEDIIIGSFTTMNTFGDSLNLLQKWQDSKLPFLVLRNQLIK